MTVPWTTIRSKSELVAQFLEISGSLPPNNRIIPLPFINQWNYPAQKVTTPWAQMAFVASKTAHTLSGVYFWPLTVFPHQSSAHQETGVTKSQLGCVIPAEQHRLQVLSVLLQSTPNHMAFCQPKRTVNSSNQRTWMIPREAKIWASNIENS